MPLDESRESLFLFCELLTLVPELWLEKMFRFAAANNSCPEKSIAFLKCGKPTLSGLLKLILLLISARLLFVVRRPAVFL